MIFYSSGENPADSSSSVHRFESLPAPDSSMRQAGLRSKQRDSESLSNSLMQRAFRGELVG
jgi:hypothetical protein